MKTERTFFTKPCMFCVAATLMLAAPVALAQNTKASKPEAPMQSGTSAPLLETAASGQALAPAMPQGEQAMAAEDEELIYEPLQIGDATQGLLAWQSSGEIASATPRTIAGAVANRSYERYLKSFEFSIPERMTSSVKSTSGGSGSSGK